MSRAELVFERARDLHEITRLADALERPIDDATRENLGALAELVARWNARIDLTAARSAEQLCEVLFADALILADEALMPRDARLLDVGSGAGAPALPLALLRSDLSMTLVEPLRKRVAFLRTVVGSIDGLAGRVEVREGRLEPRAPQLAGAPFDVAMARATFAPEVWLPLGLGLASRALVLTAGSAPTAPADARIVHEARYVLPRTSAARLITTYEKC